MTTARILGGPPSFTKAEIMDTVEGHLDELVACYRKALARNPTLAGDLTLMLTINEDGKVTTSMCAMPGLSDRPLRECASARASAWRFPKPADGLGSFQYTLEFAP